jgi:membrane-bound ClpP family serine protease
MVDPNLTVYRYTRTTDGLVEFMSETEARGLAHPEQWRQGDEVTEKGRLFKADGQQAVEFGLADDVVDGFEEFRRLYGLESDVRLVEPGWADTLIDALRSPGVAWFLLLVGGAALYAELQSPGIGVGAFISAVCFLIFFWSNYLGGTAGWLEVLLFILGVSCLLLEVFVLPGFGVFGLGGLALVLVSVVLATQTFVFVPKNEYQLSELQKALFIVVLAGAGGLGLISVLNRYLPRAPMLNRMLLAPPSEDEQAEISRRESLASFEHLVGRHGTTITPLTPAGKARIEGALVNVISSGELVERGTEVVVVEARGSRVVVRAVDA